MVCLVFAIAIANSGVVSAADEVRASEVAPDDGVEYRFPGSGVSHRGGENAQHDPGFGQKSSDQFFIPFQDGPCGVIAPLLDADQRLNEQPVCLLQGKAKEVFVGAVRYIPRLKPHHRRPTVLLELAGGILGEGG